MTATVIIDHWFLNIINAVIVIGVPLFLLFVIGLGVSAERHYRDMDERDRAA